MTSRVGGSPFISPWINPSKAVKSDRCGGGPFSPRLKLIVTLKERFLIKHLAEDQVAKAAAVWRKWQVI